MSSENLKKYLSMGKGTLMEALGMEFIHIDSDRVEAKMPVDHRTIQPYGVLHGGATAALAETIGSFGSHFLVAESGGEAYGIELNINHLRSVREGWVRGVASIKHKGRTMHVWNIDVFDDAEKLIATSRLTVMIREGKNG